MANASFGPWEPLSVGEVSEVFASFPGQWWIAGGWAIDLWIGRQTRQHEDIDVLICRTDQAALFDLLPGWEIHAAGMPNGLTLWEPATPFPAEVHDIWCRPRADAPWTLQVMLLETEGDRWIFRRDSRIGGPLDRLGHLRDGVPFLVPEVQLLFKSKAQRAKDQADLQNVLQTMPEDRIRWLLAALALHDPGNSWCPVLADALAGSSDRGPL